MFLFKYKLIEKYYLFYFLIPLWIHKQNKFTSSNEGMI